jgi:methionyl-tRNA synthetase
MLLSANIQLPKNIFVHGFITSGGHKMSKSLDNIVSPFEVVEKYGTEPLRYYLLAEIPSTDDGDFTYERFIELYNGELANNLGNLINRVVTMTNKYFDGVVPKTDKTDEEQKKKYLSMWERYHRAFSNFDLKKAIEEVMMHVDDANKYIEVKKPWVLAKEDEPELKNVIYNLLEMMRQIGYALYPFIPVTSRKILASLELEPETDNFKKAESWGKLIPGGKVNKCEQLFPRI